MPGISALEKVRFPGKVQNRSAIKIFDNIASQLFVIQLFVFPEKPQKRTFF